MTLKLVDSAPVYCAGCRRRFGMERETIRQLIDAGLEPKCPACTTKPDGKTRPAATNAEVVLLAAREFADVCEGGRVPQTGLIVRAWGLDRSRLGLDGFEEQFPDSNKIIVLLVQMCREGGGRYDGTLYRPAQRSYALTPKGIALAKRLTPPES